MNLLYALAIAAAAWWLYRHLTRGATGSIARIRGNGKYSVDVVGESFHAASFAALLGDKAGTEDEVTCDAMLTLEDDNPHDPQAVAVSIDGHPVGHLPRKLARDLRDAMKRDGIAGRRSYAVGCRIYCGGPDRMFSVTVDLPEA